MRRQDIISGMEQVTLALRNSKISDALRSVLTGRPEGGMPHDLVRDIFSASTLYFIAAQNFNGAARYVVATLDLEDLEDKNFWASMMSGQGRSEMPRLHLLYSTSSFAEVILPKLMALFEPDSVTIRANKTANAQSLEVITLLLPEDAREYSRPQRLVDALAGISKLYEAVALLHSEPENALTVIGCDSGSDKSFDLLGAAKVVTEVKELILAVWDRAVFYREKKLGARLDLVARSLPILERVGTLELEGKVGKEQAEKIRRRVEEGVNQLMAAGAVIPEMAQRSHFEPREILAPEPKLLASAPEPITEEDGALTEEEKATLDDLRKKGSSLPKSFGAGKELISSLGLAQGRLPLAPDGCD